MDGQNPDRKPAASSRAALWATAGIVAILGLAVFVVAFVVPFLQTRAVVRGAITGEFGDLREGGAHQAIERLGGPARAAPRLGQYLRLPERLAPRSEGIAIRLLRDCGEPAVPELVRLLGSRDARLRADAAWALGLVRPEAKDAVPALEKALKDKDPQVRRMAAEALKSIRAEAPEAPE